MSEYDRPEGLDDTSLAALGKLGEALEMTERARGHVYSMHQLTGGADAMLDDAARLLREAGHDDLAERLHRELVGCNVLAGRWTFQLVDEYDDDYYAVFKELERAARDRLAGGRRHLHEAEMKRQRRSPREPGHEMWP